MKLVDGKGCFIKKQERGISLNMNKVSSKSRVFSKIIALLVVFLVLFSEAGMALKYGVSYASSGGNNGKYVEFDAYLIDNAHEATYKIDSDEAKLYINLSLKENGYLKNGVISFENENFDIVSEKVQNENIEKIEGNVITLKQVNNGASVNLELPIKIKKSEQINTDMFAKEFSTKLTGTFVDSEAEEKEVQSSVENKLNWTADAKANTTLNIQKYVPFNSNENYGVLLQIRANTKVENNILPVKNTNLKVQSPEINGQKASEVKATANRTTATNGKNDGLEFGENNWKYDTETGLVEINVENQANENGEISWVQNADDEYLISFIYEGKEIYDYIEENGFNTSIKATTNISVYASDEMNLEENVTEGKIELDQKVSDIVNFEVISEETEINKGQIYSNYDAKEKKEIEYNLKYVADIGYAEILDYIQFEQKDYDEFLTKDGDRALTTIGSNNYTKNKTIRVNVSMFNKLLGEDGYIEVLDEKDNKIATINKDTEKDNDTYIVDLSELNNNKLKIKTSKPITEGKLSLDITKVISSKIDYSRDQMETFTSLKSSVNGQTGLTEMGSSDAITLSEPTTKAEIKFNSDGKALDLSTTKTHDNLEMRIVLDTSSNSNALYKNPSFEVKFPNVIENVTINDIKLANENNLKIANQTVEKTKDGTVVLKIELKGTQTDYNVGDALKGTNIVIGFGLELDKLATNSTEQVVMTYTNENSEIFEQANSEGNGTASTNMNIVAPAGVIAASGMSGYLEDGKGEVYTLKNEKTVEKLSINAPEKTVRITNDIVNNYDNSLGELKILGTLPVNGNTITDGQEQLQNNIDIKLASGIEISDYDTAAIKIYYTENANPSNDLNNAANGWTEVPNNMNAVKSYMIVVNGEFKPSTHLNFGYDITVPANLEFSQSAYTRYTAYYNNLSKLGVVPETKEAAIVGATTGAGPSLSVKLEANREANSDLQAGGIAKFTALVTNNGEADATNVRLTVPTPDGTKAIQYNDAYDTYDTLQGDEQVYTLGTIKPGETVTKVYEIQMMGDIEMFEEGYRKEITYQVSAVSDEDNNPATSNTYTLYKVRGDLEMEMVATTTEEIGIQRGAQIRFRISIENISNIDISNLTVSSTMPDGVKILEGRFEEDRHITDDEVNINGNTVEGIYPNLVQGDNVIFEFIIEIEDYEGQLDVTLAGDGDSIDTNYSNTMTYNVNAIDLSFEQTSSSPDYVQEGDELKFSYSIKNNGNSTIPSLYFTNEVPEGLKFKEMTEGVKGEESSTTSNGGAKIIKTTILQLNPGEEYNIDITFTATTLPNENTRQVVNYGVLNVVNRYEMESNKITKYVEYDPGMHGEDPAYGRYVIAGVAWNDQNANGQRDLDETLIPDIEVLLLDKATNQIVKDADTNENKITKTDANGAYRFDNLQVGEYAVAFLYDTGRYEITEYQKKDVNQTMNSDALEVDLTYNGQLRKAGMTDTIQVTSANVRNIDIGLLETERFDLSLSKEVSKITLTTPTIGTREYVHNNSVAKVELLDRNVGNSTMLVEYKITVKNEGGVPGYATTIVDYLPDEFTFNSELNKDWYEGNDGNIYTNSLENEEIQPGETKEITLLVSKKITESTIGIINNTAEIYEAYNELGLADVDSTPGNGVANEDDMASSDVVVSLVTGKIVTYTAIICTVLGILTIGVYLIKTRVLDVRKR